MDLKQDLEPPSYGETARFPAAPIMPGPSRRDTMDSSSTSMSLGTASIVPLPPTTADSIRICTVALTSTDKIRLIGTPPELTAPLRSGILESWGTIQRESCYAGSHEFKLKGKPWHVEGPDSVRARRLLAAVLLIMARNGWNLLQSTGMTRRDQDRDTLFFEHGVPDAQVELFTVSFNRSDRIRVIGLAPLVSQMVTLLKQAISSQWKYGIQREKDYCGAYELKLEGRPFVAGGDQSIFTRMMLAQMLANFRAAGFKLYGSVNIGEGSDENEVESWVFRRATPCFP
ncbi:hypothetical protein BGW38_000025 [Lunasporangiospora selenospora]|uniref:Uncharacterized protein n=1 Tax=Lunasporangiospora selenospora TaxID=979761 RepID=A0A9P6G4C2_9FUNG|nr:hypothetical protein BGW38_000025 [Lunasporangiospora selenospora]